ncbi:MAG: aminotransferase class V-fold PLP-dependent enzyme, partial [Actinomyces sp.]
EATAAADLVSVTAHKIGGPVGVGALVVADGVELEPLVSGGGQERGRRAGTPAVALAAAFAAACEVTAARRREEVERLRGLRDALLDGLADALGDRLLVTAAPEGERDHLVAGIAHVCLAGVDSEALLFLLDEAGVRASAASSCSSGAQQASHVLAAMGVPEDWARSSLRLSLGYTTTAADVERGLEAVVAAVRRLDRHGGG